MEKGTNIRELFFELIRLSIGTQDGLSRVPSEKEWHALRLMSDKQSLTGICFCGAMALANPEEENYAGLTESEYYEWLSQVLRIQQSNSEINCQCVQIQNEIEKAGFRTYIMKGQGNATLYGNLAEYRQPGDIDIYVNGGFRRVLEYVYGTFPTKEINELEIHYDFFPDTEVEIHYRPFIMRNPFRNRKLQQFFSSHENECFNHRVSLGDAGEISVPTTEFNIVHQMVHIYHHLFTEGVGMRQLMDYYFVLNNSSGNENVKKTISSLGLSRFASALMWVLKYVFYIDDSKLLLEPDEKRGRLLLNEIMLSGNFGIKDKRQKKLRKNKWNSYWIVNLKAVRLMTFDPWMWFWGPLWRLYHFIWRKCHGFK